MLFQVKLKKLRKDKEISQYDLALTLNISRSVIVKWKTGLTLPNEENIHILCEYFNLTKDELMGNFENQEIIAKKNQKNITFQKDYLYFNGTFIYNHNYHYCFIFNWV